MSYAALQQLNERVFRLTLVIFVLKLAVLWAFVALCIRMVVQSGALWWWSGVLLALGVALILACQYNANAVIVGRTHLICRRGLFTIRQHAIPLWRLTFEIKQNVPGRLLGYGTLLVHTDDGATIEIHQIALILDLQATIIERQEAVLREMARSQLPPGY